MPSDAVSTIILFCRIPGKIEICKSYTEVKTDSAAC